MASVANRTTDCEGIDLLGKECVVSSTGRSGLLDRLTSAERLTRTPCKTTLLVATSDQSHGPAEILRANLVASTEAWSGPTDGDSTSTLKVRG